MTSHDFRGVLHAQPFCPSSFSTVDGATYTVDTPEDTWLAPDGEIVAVSAPGGVGLVGIEWITRVAFTPYPPGVTGQSERLRDLKRAEPFVPFVIELTDGRRFLVESADHINDPEERLNGGRGRAGRPRPAGPATRSRRSSSRPTRRASQGGSSDCAS